MVQVATQEAADNPSYMDYRLLHGIDAANAEDGVTWSVHKKNKSLSKFGRRAGVGSTAVTVGDFGGEDNETLSTTNNITTLVSSDAADTQIIKIEYHTINPGGDALTFGVQTVTLTGQTPAPLPVPAARVSRMYNTNGTLLVGDVWVYEGGAITTPANGPDDATTIHAQIVAGTQQTKKAATSISNVDTFFITEIVTSVLAGTPGSQVIDFDLEMKALDGVWLPILEWTNQVGGLVTLHQTFNPVIRVPPNYDVRILALAASGSGVDVSASMRGYLATIGI